MQSSSWILKKKIIDEKVPSLFQKISMVVGDPKSRVIIPKVINQSFISKVKTTADLNQRGSKIYIHNLQCTTCKMQLPSSAIENRESSCSALSLFFYWVKKSSDWSRLVEKHKLPHFKAYESKFYLDLLFW